MGYKMVKKSIFVFLCFLIFGCANRVKQSEITAYSSSFSGISGSVNVTIKQAGEQKESYVFDESLYGKFEKNCMQYISAKLRKDGIKVNETAHSAKYNLVIKYALNEEVNKRIYNFKGGYGSLSSLYKVKTSILLSNLAGDELLNLSLDNLSNFTRKGGGNRVLIENMSGLGQRVGELIGLVVLNVKPEPASIKGKWLNANSGAYLTIKDSGKSDELIGIEDELYNGGGSSVKVGEIELLHIDFNNIGKGAISKFEGEAQHINKVTDDADWMNAEMEIIGGIMFVKYSNFANEETAVYVKK